MENERREQAAPATPILDSLIAKLPPPKFEHRMEIHLKPVTQALNRLTQKIEAGTLTQWDIENELSSLPNVSGIEEGKMKIVRFVQMNVPGYNIKKLPVG